MAADAERVALKALAAQRAGLEAEMEVILSRLNAPGMPGVKGGLVDAEGFPRADIDVHAVRTDRNRLAVLKTDHARLSDALERGLHALHATARAAGPPAAAAAAHALEPKRPRLDDAAAAQQQQQQQAAASSAFAVIDEVSPSSPAAAAGLLVGDAVLSLGGVRAAEGHAGGAAALAALGPAVASSEGRPLEVVVLRRGERVALSLTPRRWEGRGLLGCHLRPLS